MTALILPVPVPVPIPIPDLELILEAFGVHASVLLLPILHAGPFALRLHRPLLLSLAAALHRRCLRDLQCTLQKQVDRLAVLPASKHSRLRQSNRRLEDYLLTHSLTYLLTYLAASKHSRLLQSNRRLEDTKDLPLQLRVGSG